MNARVLRPKINAWKNTNILKTFDYRGLADNSENPENGGLSKGSPFRTRGLDTCQVSLIRRSVPTNVMFTNGLPCLNIVQEGVNCKLGNDIDTYT
jgi:hypothetical protein